MQTVSSSTCAIVMAAIIASANGVCAQETRLKVPKVIVLAQAAPGEPPYMRDPWKSYARNPYFGRYRVEEGNFAEVPCTATRIAFAPGGRCLQGYRLTLPEASTSETGANSCDMALDVVGANTGKLYIEADILAFDPYKVTASGSSPRWCYVHGYLGYDQEDFQDMNEVTLLHRHIKCASRGHRLCARLPANSDLRPGRQFEKSRRSDIPFGGRLAIGSEQKRNVT